MATSSPALNDVALQGERTHARRGRLPTLRLLRPQDHPTVASREADDGLSVVLVGLSVLLLSIGGFVGAFWVAVDLEIAPPNQVSFDRWWFFPVGMLAATLGVTIALYRRGCRRSVVVLGALSTAGLAVLLVFCPYL